MTRVPVSRRLPPAWMDRPPPNWPNAPSPREQWADNRAWHVLHGPCEYVYMNNQRRQGYRCNFRFHAERVLITPPPQAPHTSTG